MAAGPYINLSHFSCSRGTIHKRPLTFCATAGPSIRISSTFCTTVFQCVLSAYVNFTCVRRTICQLFLWRRDISLIFVRPQDSLSIFRASVGLSVNFHQLSVRPLNLPSTSINNLCGHGPSVNFPCIRGTFCQLSMRLRDHLSTFRMSGDVLSTSVNFLCVQGTIYQIFVCQCEHSVILSKHSVRPRDLPLTFFVIL